MNKLVAYSSFLFWGWLVSACGTFQGYEPASFKVTGDIAVMSGVIDAQTLTNLKTLLRDHPEVGTIIMQEVDGSVDDEVNLKAARLIRQNGLNTLVPANGLIASGGTDFFLAGNQRRIVKGAKIGVHSWAGGGINNPSGLPKDHHEHKKYLIYYHEMGIPAEFYWFTLNAASSEDMHWMTDEEIHRYQLTTH